MPITVQSHDMIARGSQTCRVFFLAPFGSCRKLKRRVYYIISGSKVSRLINQQLTIGHFTICSYGSIIRGLPLFRGLGDEVINVLCRICVPIQVMKGQVRKHTPARARTHEPRHVLLVLHDDDREDHAV